MTGHHAALDELADQAQELGHWWPDSQSFTTRASLSCAAAGFPLAARARFTFTDASDTMRLQDFGAFLVPLDGRPRNLPDTAACGDVRGGDFGGLLFASQREACRNPQIDACQ